MGRKQGTGQPDPTKDRSAHDAARGVKQMALSDVSKLLPTTEQIGRYHELVLLESDRGAAIMMAAFVELGLKDAIRSRIADPGDTIAHQWFDGDTAPFGSFAAKIQLGRALGIYGPVMHGQLTTIKNVRNQFAHCAVPVDFSHPAIVEETKGLRPDPLPQLDPIRTRFVSTCLALAHMLGEDATRRGGGEMEVTFP